jgi:nucleotide-binding universal stress UspA family protein
MYKHILVPTDGTPLSDKAVQDGVALAKTLSAQLTTVTVSKPFHVLTADTQMLGDTPAAYKTRIAAKAQKILSAVSEIAKESGIWCATVHCEHEHPYQAIIDTAEAQKCDLIVMASHGRRGMSAIVLGSETVKVLTHSKIPVLVHR